jgi:nucleoside recognition membrane protein YjiH
MEQVQGETASVMSLKDWVISVIISVIPVVGFIMLLVWSFSDSANPNKKNWARATLIVYVAAIVLYFIFAAIFMGAMMSSGAFDSM